MIRQTVASDSSPILRIIEDSGQFDEDALAHVRQTLAAHLAGPGNEIWLTAADPEAVGVAYCAPEPVAPGVWNLLMLWTRDDRHGRGHGAALLHDLEQRLDERNARLLIVETSSLTEFAPARRFYEKSGFVHEASIKNFFADGDDKLVFTKPVGRGSVAAAF